MTESTPASTSAPTPTPTSTSTPAAQSASAALRERAPFVARPQRVRLVVIPVAILLVVVFVIVAILLKSRSTGVDFGLSDRVSLVLIGIALGAATLVFIRPVVHAHAEGVDVRNVFFGQRISWDVIRNVSFPDGAPWARLELPADEYVPVVAIQALDGEKAVLAIRELRAWHRAARAALAEQSEQAERSEQSEAAAKNQSARNTAARNTAAHKADA